MSKFSFELGDKVKIVISEESGEVIGRAEYKPEVAANNYLVRYLDSEGRAREAWWTADALVGEATQAQPAS